MSLTQVWPAEALWEAVAPQLPGFTVEILPTLGSTNTELMQRARSGQTEPILLVAEQQTAGRGRLGRDWQSQRGDSLTFSLGLPLAPADWSGLSLAVGVAVASCLPPEVRLKWPNDLWWQGRKLGGILIETASFGSSRYAVIGVGLNLARPPADSFSAQVTGTAPVAPAWVHEFWPEMTAPQLLRQAIPPLVQTVQAFAALGFSAFQARFNARDVLCDCPVTLSDGRVGTAHGVDETGALRVMDDHGLQRVSSAEVSVRPSRLSSH